MFEWKERFNTWELSSCFTIKGCFRCIPNTFCSTSCAVASFIIHVLVSFFFLYQGQTHTAKKKVTVFLTLLEQRCLNLNSKRWPHNHSHTLGSLSALFPRKTLTHIHTNIFFFSTPPTFIPIVGTDSEDGKAYICILVHVHLVGCLRKHGLVIVHIADEDSNVSRVWKKINKKMRKRERFWEREGNKVYYSLESTSITIILALVG